MKTKPSRPRTKPAARRTRAAPAAVAAPAPPAESEALARAERALSDLKRAEHALQATQERLERVLSSSPTVIYALAIEGESAEMAWVSRNILSLLGYSDEEAHEPGWWLDRVHPDDRPLAESGLARLFSEGEMTQEYRFLRKDGTFLWIRDDARLRRDPDGQPVEVFGSWSDITERRQAQEVLERAKAQTEERLRIVAQATHDAIWDWDPASGRVWWSQGMHTIFGHAPEAIAPTYDWWLDHVHPEDRDRTHEGLMAALEGGEGAWAAEYRFQRADGLYAFVLDRGQVLRVEGGRAARMIGTIIDITERKRAEEALHEANDKLTAWVAELEQRNREMSLLGEMGELLQTCTDADEAYGVVAHQAEQLFLGESGALYVFKGSRSLVEAVASWGEPPPDAPAFAPEECWALRRGRLHFVEDAAAGLECRHVGSRPHAGYVCIPMMAQGEATGVLHLASHGARLHEGRRQFAQTVAESLALGLANVRLREQLRSQAIRDPLTGLFNRRFMEEALEREVRRAARRVSPLSVIMLDLDHFKKLNDTHGHDAGDSLLREMGIFLQTRVRAGDVACRYGGEEITLILPDAPLDDARQRAEDLREGVRKIQIQERGRTIGPVTVSLGVAAYPDHGASAEELLRAADEALYRAKDHGRDRVMVAGER